MSCLTEIICTIGPASSNKETLIEMAKAGMSIARINFSHGDHLQHQKVINIIREINEEGKHKIKILQDLEGYRIRVGVLKQPIELKKNKIMWMSNTASRKKNFIPLQYDSDIKGIREGFDIFIDDGNLHLKVLGFEKKNIKLQVLQGGILKSNKGINIPELKLGSNILTDQDRNDIEFGIRNKFDYVAQSFVRNKKDIIKVGRLVNKHLPKCKIIAKVENKSGLRNIDSIIASCDGIMIARGDLGVSLPIYQIPVIQKDIIRRCNKKHKFVVTATQMLETMTEHFRPTRAEVSDVANAVLDGTDYVMLSGETAVGRFPVQTVKMMRQIIEYTEDATKRKW